MKKYKNLHLILDFFFNFLGMVALTAFFLKINPEIAFIAPLFFLSDMRKLKFREFNFKKLKEEINDIRNLKKNSVKE